MAEKHHQDDSRRASTGGGGGRRVDAQMRQIFLVVNKFTLLQGLSEDGGRKLECKASANTDFPSEASQDECCRNSIDPNPDPFKWCSELNIPTYMGCHGRFLRVLPLPRKVCVPGGSGDPSLVVLVTHPWRVAASHLWRSPAAVKRKPMDGKNRGPKIIRTSESEEFYFKSVKFKKKKKKCDDIVWIFSLYINLALSWNKNKKNPAK